MTKKPLMALVLGVVYAALAFAAFSGVARNTLDPSWRPPVPPAVMAALGVGLLLVAGGWAGMWREARGAAAIVAVGSVLGVAIGIYGLWGLTVLLEPCLAPTATLAASWPEGICASLGPSYLVGGYLVSIGVMSVLSLVMVWRLT